MSFLVERGTRRSSYPRIDIKSIFLSLQVRWWEEEGSVIWEGGILCFSSLDGVSKVGGLKPVEVFDGAQLQRPKTEVKTLVYYDSSLERRRRLYI